MLVVQRLRKSIEDLREEFEALRKEPEKRYMDLENRLKDLETRRELAGRQMQSDGTYEPEQNVIWEWETCGRIAQGSIFH
jgi:hypothetical protein